MTSWVAPNRRPSGRRSGSRLGPAGLWQCTDQWRRQGGKCCSCSVPWNFDRSLAIPLYYRLVNKSVNVCICPINVFQLRQIVSLLFSLPRDKYFTTLRCFHVHYSFHFLLYISTKMTLVFYSLVRKLANFSPDNTRLRPSLAHRHPLDNFLSLYTRWRIFPPYTNTTDRSTI